MKNILFVIDSLRPGGAERQLVELIKRLDRTKYNVHLYCLLKVDDGYTNIIEGLGIKINYVLRNYKYDLISPIIELVKYIKCNQIVLIHTYLNLGSLIGCTAAKISHCKIICSAIREANDKNWKMWLSKRYLSYISDVYISNSKAGFHNRFRKLKPHFKVVYNGVDFSRFEKINIDDIKNDLGIKYFDKVIGSVGTLNHHKDQESLIYAFNKVIKVFPRACLLLIGDGPNKNYLIKLTNSLGINNSVIFSGFRSDIDKLYGVFDVSVLLTNTALISEGISNVILESMASGVPVIASLGGGTGEIIEKNINGITVDESDRDEVAKNIIELLSNNSKCSYISSNAKRFVEINFSIESHIKKLDKLYSGELSK